MYPEPRPTGGAGVEADGFCVGYGASQVLHALSLHFPARRTTVVLGPGGCGKTTLLHALGGRLLSRPRPWIRGTLVRPAPSPTWLPQKLSSAGRTLRQMLAEDVGLSAPEEALQGIWQCVPEAGESLAGHLDEPVEALPTSLARLAELTVASAGRGWLLLDEPDAEMSPQHRRWVEKRLADLRGRVTLIVATHHLGLARAVADHVVLLVDGRIVESGESDAFFSRPIHPRTQHLVRVGS